MHELSICRGLCTQLQELAGEHGAEKIRRVEIEVGAMSNVVPELLDQAFRVMRESEPLIADAELVIQKVPLKVHCAECDGDHTLERFVFECPTCGSTRLMVTQGEEMLLRQVELEVEEEVR
jgi:hydrogenase nickel incorporation protein HypA/HybF